MADGAPDTSAKDDAAPVNPEAGTAAPAEAAAAAPAADAGAEHPADVPTLLEGVGKDAGAKSDDAPPAKADGDKAPEAKESDAKAADDKAAADKAEGEKDADAKPADKADDKDAEKDAAKVDVKADGATDDKAKDAAPTEPAPLEPIAYEYVLPEVIAMDDTARGEFHGVLDAFRSDPAKGAQSLLDMHARTMTQYAEQLRADQISTFNKTRAGWRKDILSDEQLGGSGHRTAMGAVARMRDMFVTEKDRPAFENFLRITGAGDHPEFLRMLHNAARYFDEPTLPPNDIKPPPNNGRAPRSKQARLYDHPTSTKQS